MLSTISHPSQSIYNTNNLITNINNNKEKRKIGSTYLQKKRITNTVLFHRNSYFQTQDDNIYIYSTNINSYRKPKNNRQNHILYNETKSDYNNTPSTLQNNKINTGHSKKIDRIEFQKH